MPTPAPDITEEQSTALFDVLTHKALYDEICQFKSPSAIQNYGPPFQDNVRSESPILQALLTRFALTLPSLKSISTDFWKLRIKKLIEALSEAELSESYDTGVLGIRKTCATAISALVEYPARGLIWGFPRDEEALKERKYDPKKPEDVVDAFHDFLQQLIHGELWEELFTQTAKTDKLSEQSTLIQSAHEFILVNLASFMHYTLILSPEGPSILRLVENVHKLAPYTVMRQTLKIGNVATMINGMVKIVLAKVSVGSITNWVGWSKDADEGMNLLQSIISTVLGWDKRELRKRIEKIEKDRNCPPKEVRQAIDEYIDASRAEHEECRARSRDQSMSIVAVIMSLSSSSVEMSKVQHEKALEYLALQLGVRDRREIVRVLCHSNPDHLTQAVRDGVTAYDPMIRNVHQAVDLSQTLWDFEVFVTAMIKMSKPGKDSKLPSVEDYVRLLHEHMSSTHRFLHQVAKNGTEVTSWFKTYCLEASENFKKDKNHDSAGVQEALKEEFGNLSDSEQKEVLAELDAFSTYLTALHSASGKRIKDVVAGKSTTSHGPGAYLARWQDLLDSTPITPVESEGPVRYGSSNTVKKDTLKDVDGKAPDSRKDASELGKSTGNHTPGVPIMERTLELMGPRLRNILLEKTSPSSGLRV